MNVKHAAFADPSDTYFEREGDALKDLLTKSGTAENPYLYLPPTLTKLCLFHHPPGEVE